MMSRPSSNHGSALWVHGLWALVVVAAFGGGYLASWSEAPPRGSAEAPVSPLSRAGGTADHQAAMVSDSWPKTPGPGGDAVGEPGKPGDERRGPQVSPTPLRETGGTAATTEGMETTDDRIPPRGEELTPDQAHRLLSGTVLFQPSPIKSSNVPVTADTMLSVGQHVQVQWGGQWWAGTIRGLGDDGQIRIHYFGWADSWDEGKTREELQLDPTAPLQAVDTVYRRRK